MERTDEVKTVKEEIVNKRIEMQTSVKDEKRYLELRKELKALRRKLTRMKYDAMIKSSNKQKGR